MDEQEEDGLPLILLVAFLAVMFEPQRTLALSAVSHITR